MESSLSAKDFVNPPACAVLSKKLRPHLPEKAAKHPEVPSVRRWKYQ